MIDGGVIAGYLALAVARGVDRFVNGRIESILNSLASKMRLGPAADLKRDPADVQVQNKIARSVVKRSQNDPRFRRDFGTIQDQLDPEDGRLLLQQFWNNSDNQAYGGNVVQAHRVSGDVAGQRHPQDCVSCAFRRRLPRRLQLGQDSDVDRTTDRPCWGCCLRWDRTTCYDRIAWWPTGWAIQCRRFQAGLHRGDHIWHLFTWKSYVSTKGVMPT